MKRTLMLLALSSLAVTPAFAQSRSVDLTAWVTWVDPSGHNTFEDFDGTDDLDVRLDTAQGFGVGLNVFLSNRISAEFAVSLFEPDVELAISNPALAPLVGSLEMMPITGTLQFHFNPDGRIDPYIGAGVAYVLFDEIADFDDVDLDAIDFDDDYGFLVNAGVSFDITPNFAINLDAKYVPVESAARAVVGGVGSDALDIEINPLILSVGLSFQF
ncbi:MAG TPA: OmpW family outer membrane protein [Thermoanaerobaculia bacterium]|nr:OmpW family outer membrane protein [Thermoanaerobaculia bacterium]